MAADATCKAENCDKAIHAKGYCARHYRSWRKGKMGKPRYRTCVEEGCRKARVRRSLCLEHFNKKHARAVFRPARAPQARCAARW
jgi:hypothetical protein